MCERPEALPAVPSLENFKLQVKNKKISGPAYPYTADS